MEKWAEHPIQLTLRAFFQGRIAGMKDLKALFTINHIEHAD